jgi:nickel-dependent lactate racemase
MIELPWGDTTLSVPIPSTWKVLGRFEPAPLRPAADPTDLCRQALTEPIGAAPLATRPLRGKRVLFLVDDLTRPTPVRQFFAVVRDALLAAGVVRQDMEILFALGVHRPMTEAEAQAKVGRDNLAGHRWHNHICQDPAQLLPLGTTSRGTRVALNRLLPQFDLIVPLGSIEPHLLLGFSGGAKMILPGCASALTIGQNHLQGATDGRFNYVGALPEESPMRQDLEEGVALLRQDVFLVNAVLNAEGGIVRFFCGDLRQAFRAGAEFVRRHAQVTVPEAADVVITNSRPFDADLRQGMKCVGNTLFAARPGGVVLGMLRCTQGVGDVPEPSWTFPYPLLRLMLRVIPARKVLRVLEWFRPRDPVEQKFLGHFGLRMLRRNHIWFFGDNLPADVGRKIGMIRQFPDVDGMIRAARRKVGRRATVAIFPYGGATYASLPDPQASQEAKAKLAF